MALEESRFFDAVDNDVSYSADEFAEFFSGFLTDGVKNLGSCLKVLPDTGMDIKIDYGQALIQGYSYWLKNDGTGVHKLTVDYERTYKRIDRVVLRLDKSVSGRQIRVSIIKGTPLMNPVPPTLTRNAQVYELSLAQIVVSTSSTTIKASDITDERSNAEVCGMINSMITLDLSELEAQFQTMLSKMSNYVNEALPIIVVPKGTTIPPIQRQIGRYYFVVKDYLSGDTSKWTGEWQDWTGKIMYPESKRSDAISVAEGGTGAVTAADARNNLGVAASLHTHTVNDVSGTVPVNKGGTGATTAAVALTNLGAAALNHTHAIATTTGTLTVARGGTGATTAAAALSNLGIKYSSTAPANPTTGTIWLKPV